MVGIAVASPPKNVIRSSPMPARISLTMPTWKSSIRNQTSAAMTFEMRNGSRITARTAVFLVSRCIRTPIATARIVWKTMLRKTYSSVTFIAFQNSASPTSLV